MLMTIRQKQPNPFFIQEIKHGMDENRVNNTDPVVQVRLRVLVGNFHGTLKKVCLAAGFVYPNFRRVSSY